MSSTEPLAALTLDALRLTFHPGTPDERVALDGLSLRMDEGDFAVVIGSNGAGKSTMLNVISGALSPDSGRVLFGAHDVTPLPVHRRAAYIGRVFQDPMLGTAPALSIEENLALAQRRGLRRGLGLALGRGNRQHFADLLAPFGLGLETRMSVRAGTLSGGQRQVLALLMAAMQKPRLLLLDEHTAALDPGTAELVMQATRRIVEDGGLTTLMITHNMQHALDTGNRLLALNAGQVRLDLDAQAKAGLTIEALVRRFGASDDQLLRA